MDVSLFLSEIYILYIMSNWVVKTATLADNSKTVDTTHWI